MSCYGKKYVKLYLNHPTYRVHRYDFFLVSQSVKQGTVTPTSYNVIYDTTGLKPDFLQKITYKMTHMYFNCSVSTISFNFIFTLS